MSTIDHLVVAAATLEEGVRWLEGRVGVPLEPDAMELRRGANEWALTVPPDGRMPLGGRAPSRILWRTPPPSTLLPDSGVRLVELRLSTPDPEALMTLLVDVRGPVRVGAGPPALAATVSRRTGPGGGVELIEIGSVE
ncbi:VOC family protein [Intrasporangium calvum]|uniref:Glyoxalase-like domain-containing protein n=1 Tax=Intrasporangium calvum (strain ATCC 23552 / DSM 43043 / JCM 3097 / NBRC 12989 / NCIMB 10167 / NRRL B-3866 / 7 KIP) TaxID=710696 RepID=E6SF23_INTC7|nr:VOC family protein [Intrasporangium calvum]ADU48812.1 hypothetical protein Intca_2303 [Intrasporangium calvum DSM 43043]